MSMTNAQKGGVPGWACARAAELATGDPFAFARYIADHEDPPTDPLLIEAREIAERLGWFTANQLEALRSGRLDHCATMRGLIAAIRRGIEIGGDA